MQERGYGRIVNIASNAAIGTALPATTFYAATKAEVLILTRRFAMELGRRGITVNAVAPGAATTGIPGMSDLKNLARLLIPTVVMLTACGSQAYGQADSLTVAQLRCAALVAAVDRVPTAEYLEQSEKPGYFTMPRRRKPLFNKCMAVCDVAGATPACAPQQQSAGVAARYHELLNTSAQDAIATARERLRKGQKPHQLCRSLRQ